MSSRPSQVSWWEDHGFKLVGSGLQLSDEPFDIIIFDGLSEGDIVAVLQGDVLQKSSVTTLTTDCDLSGCVKLPGHSFAPSWPLAIAQAYFQDRLDSIGSGDSESGEPKQREAMNFENQAAVSHLIRSFTHELNNPLSVILGNAELIELMVDPADEKIVDRCRTIIQHIDQCQGIVTRLRSYAHFPAEAMDHIELTSLIHQISSEITRRNYSQKIDIIIENALPTVRGGHFSLKRIWELMFQRARQNGASRITIQADEINPSEDHDALTVSHDGSGPEWETPKDLRREFARSEKPIDVSTIAAIASLAEYGCSITYCRGAQTGGTFKLSFPRVVQPDT